MITTDIRVIRSGAAAFVAAGCLLLAACGSSGHPTVAGGPGTPGATATQPGGTAPAGPAAGSPDPCSLLTQAEVDAAVGQPLGAAQSGAEPGACQWSTADFVADVDITVADWTSIKAAATAGAHQPVAISGVGDEALNLNGSNGSILYVRKGDVGFLLTINGPKIDSLPDHGLAQEQVLATAALGRL